MSYVTYSIMSYAVTGGSRCFNVRLMAYILISRDTLYGVTCSVLHKMVWCGLLTVEDSVIWEWLEICSASLFWQRAQETWRWSLVDRSILIKKHRYIACENLPIVFFLDRSIEAIRFWFHSALQSRRRERHSIEKSSYQNNNLAPLCIHTCILVQHCCKVRECFVSKHTYLLKSIWTRICKQTGRFMLKCGESPQDCVL